MLLKADVRSGVMTYIIAYLTHAEEETIAYYYYTADGAIPLAA